MKHFAEGLLENTYDLDMTEASFPLGINVDQVVSVKLRPIRKDTENKYQNAFVSGTEYLEFRNYLQQCIDEYQRLELDTNSALLTTKSGSRILYFEHETGPELIFDYSMKAIEFISTVGGLILFITEVMKRTYHKERNIASGVSRVEAISIEERRKGKKTKLTKILRLENADGKELSKEDVQSFLQNI